VAVVAWVRVGTAVEAGAQAPNNILAAIKRDIYTGNLVFIISSKKMKVFMEYPTHDITLRATRLCVVQVTPVRRRTPLTVMQAFLPRHGPLA